MSTNRPYSQNLEDVIENIKRFEEYLKESNPNNKSAKKLLKNADEFAVYTNSDDVLRFIPVKFILYKNADIDNYNDCTCVIEETKCKIYEIIGARISSHDLLAEKLKSKFYEYCDIIGITRCKEKKSCWQFWRKKPLHFTAGVIDMQKKELENTIIEQKIGLDFTKMPDEDLYIHDRIGFKIEWYAKKASINRKWYRFLKTFIIAASAIIPLLTGLKSCMIDEQDKDTYQIVITIKNNQIIKTTPKSDELTCWEIVIACLGAGITIATGGTSLFKHHERWRSYRGAAEKLRREKYFFLNKSGNYAMSVDDKKKECKQEDTNDQKEYYGKFFPTFVQNAENIISKERDDWESYNKEQNTNC